MGNMRWAAFAAGALAIASFAANACGGSTSSDITRSSGDAGASTEAGGQEYTLDNVCERTGPIVCDLRKPCCESGPGYDRAGCLAQARRDCEADVAAARAGQATFHPERIDGCIAKYTEIFATSCTLTFDLLQKYFDTIGQCATFEGQLPTDAPCERAAQCKPATNPNEVAGCDDDTKKCRITTVLTEGQTCSIGDGLPRICGDGLYCDVSFASRPFTGVCKKKTSLGVACDKNKKPFNLECGLGNYCEPATGVCTAGKPGNAECTSDLMCASVSCTESDAGPDPGAPVGTCKPTGSLVKTAECKGP